MIRSSLFPVWLIAVGWLAGSQSTIAATAEAAHSLAGEWRFALDRGDVGIRDHWYQQSLADRIMLPGILQAQGYGDEISPTTPWVATLGDAWWKIQPESLREKFSQPGHVEVPFLAQPPRHYLGAAWYQRDIDIPAAAQGRRFVLFLERPHWESRVWLDDQPFPPDHSLVAPHVTDLGVLAPGRHRLTIRVDNRQIIRDQANDGHMTDAHSISDALGATWNGIVGRIELQSTPVEWIDDIQAFPNVETHSVVVRVAIGSAAGHAGTGTVSGAITSVGSKAAAAVIPPHPVSWEPDGGKVEFEVQIPAAVVPWDEFNPALQTLTIRLDAPSGVETRSVTFGLRTVSWRDKDLLVNGHEVNLRTTHFGGDFPLTGYPAMDVASWKRIIRVCQEYGLNGMRFHSWCPPEAAFEAADQLGFYLQPECAMWAPFNPGSTYTRFLDEETPRLLKAYGNHPSFILLSPSNEPAGHYTEVTPRWAAEWYRKDPRRLYSAGTGWSAPAQVTGGAQYATLVRFGHGELRNVRGWFGHDYRAALEDVHIPVLAHEVGQWCAYPDFDVIKEFTGYLRPGNFDIFKYIAKENGVLQYDHAFAWASGRFQLECYKEEIEANLRTPGLAGFQLLDLHDYLGQGTALIGVVDAFWKPKTYVTATEFRRFNSATVPLARLSKRTFTSDETLMSDVELYHFAAAPLAHARAYWKVVLLDGRDRSSPGETPDRGGHVVASGEFAPRDVPIGKSIPLGRVVVPLAQFTAPAAYRLVVGVTGTSAENDWEFWVYPAHAEATVPPGLTVTSDWSAARQALANAGKVLFIPSAESLDPSRSPRMSRVPVFWNIQMTVRPPRNLTPKFDAMLGLLCQAAHPALAEFPTAANCDWQWTPLIDGVRSVNLNDAPRVLNPIVATIDDWNRDWRLGVIFECKVGAGRLLVSVIDFRNPAAGPGARQLGRSLMDYMRTDRFNPPVTLTVDQADHLWSRSAAPAQAVKRTYDPDLDDGTNRPATRKQ